MIRFARRFPRWRTLFPLLALTLTVTLSACSSVAGLGPEPTAQAVAAAAGDFSPIITLSPPSGYAGTNVFVIGTGWPANLSVVVLLTDPNGISTTVASTSTDSAGNLKTDFFYPSDARWLLNAPYTVSVASADATYQAAAKFTIANPADAPTPTTVPTAVPTAVLTTAPTAIAQAPTVAPTATPVATATPLPTMTPVPTAVPTLVPTVTSQAQPANATPASNSPGVTAALIPIKNHRSSHDRYIVDIKTSGNMSDVVAILMIPPLAQVDDVKLKDRARVDVKVDPGKLEINAPDPERMLAFIEEHGGIAVQHGQEIEFKSGPQNRFRARFNGDTLTVDSPSLLLQVTVIDAAGKPHQFTVTPTAPSPDKNNGRDDDGDDDRDDDDKDGNDDNGGDDDNSGNKNGNSNGNGKEQAKDKGRGNRGRGNDS